MRISTSSMYEAQVAAIDNLVAQQQQYSSALSSGKQLTVPSDDPTQVAQDLSVRTSLVQEQQTTSNLQNVSAELTTVDGALSTLGDVVQKARAIAISGASDGVSPDQRKAMAQQVDTLLQEAIGIANTQYAGKNVFGGSSASSGAAVTAVGQPIASVAFNGNLSSQTQHFTNGQTATTSVTLQQAFNYGAADGSPDIFRTLISLRDTLNNGTIADVSASGVNKAGNAISAATALNSSAFGTALVPDSSGSISFTISSAQQPNGQTFTFAPTASVGSVVAAINAAGIGVTASFDPKREKLTLSSTGNQPFTINDTASAGATNSANFVAAFGLQSQADLTNTISGQIGDIDHATQVATNARAALGGTIQTLNNLSASTNSQVVNDTKVQSSIEDADIAKVISEFSQAQTALQAAYGTTTRLESKTLFDYLQ